MELVSQEQNGDIVDQVWKVSGLGIRRRKVFGFTIDPKK